MRNEGECHRGDFRSRSGFTLLELLAVITIIGILSAIALPAISRIRERGRIAAVKEQLRHIETALDAYYAEWDTFPPVGNDWLGGGFFPSEDVGRDGIGPFTYSGGQWIPNPAYDTAGGPDADGTEGNYRMDDPVNEDQGIQPWLGAADPTRNNKRLDGTYYSRLDMITDADKQGLIDIFADATYYHYYPGYVYRKTALGMPEYRDYAAGYPAGLNDYKSNHPAFYNRWVIYSVGPDGDDHGLHNYYLTMQDGEDVGSDAFASDVTDQDGNRILFEPNTAGGENDGNNTNFVQGIVRETGFRTPNTGSERLAPGGTNNALPDGPQGKPVFSFDVRAERRREQAVYLTPDGQRVAFGVIMRYGP